MPHSFGQVLLAQAIPSAYRPEGVYTKKTLQQNMVRLAKDNPEQYTKVITEVKRLGDEFATHEGVSVGLDDLEPLYAQRDAITKPALAQLKKTTDRKKRQQIIADTQSKLIDYTVNHPGTMSDMVRSGAKGSPMQLVRTIGAPAAANDEHNKLQPWLTVHSYAEGLRPSEWWACNREARMGAVKANIEVVEPGDLSKILANNTSDQIVSGSDCGTSNGLSFKADSSNLLDRYLAKSVSGIPANTLITPRIIAQLKKQNALSILVRSPMTCEASVGVCQRCMGLNTVGKLNNIGENVGIRASHVLGEPLTQLALNAKHGGRISGIDPKEVSGVDGFRAILESPMSFKNKAALAPQDGTVTAVTLAPQGGYFISVGIERLYVAPGLLPLVKIGDQVRAGDVLSEGVPKPDEVVKYKGLGAGRAYVVDKLSGIYNNAGINVDRRHFEVLAKSTLNHLRIDEVDDKDSAEHGLIRGDIIDYNQFRNVIAKSVHEVTVSKAVGRHLGEGVLHHLAGTLITDSMVSEFKRAGIKKVKVTMHAPSVSPMMAAATRNPLLNPDWLVRLGHRYLKQSILEGAHQGQKTDLHGAHPIPALVFSAEFGEGADGRY